MPSVEDMPAVLVDSPLSLWVLGIGAITYLFTQLPKITEGGGNAITRWIEAQQRTSKMKDDADIDELKRQVANLTAELSRMRREVADLRADMRHRDTVAWDHYRWGVTAYQLIVSGIGSHAIDPPPDLWVQDPSAEGDYDGAPRGGA